VIYKQIDPVATGKRIKSLCKERGLTVRELQARMGIVSRSSIFKWMRGASIPTVDNLVLLADILGVTVDKIIVTKEGPTKE